VLVAALANKEVASRDALLGVWEKDPKCKNFPILGGFVVRVHVVVLP